ncbi:DUF4194 domain-containing protein [Rubritalea tangerina]|uniref:DUF4194 domain-containing protein n=1 Tax=Rubritalea tangerina TaxID=430798 RepID=A0ABW4Z768_9BACT
MNPTTIETDTDQSLFNNTMRERDKQMLQDVAHRLLAHGSLLRGRPAERPLYDWAIEHQPWLEEWAALLGLKIIIQRDERLIMAIPEVPSLTRKLKRDETLVALSLWYDYDVEVRENGAHDVFFNLREFNEQFQSKFPSMHPLSQSRMKEILRRFARFNLIEMDWEDEFSDSVIQILPTLRFAIPFPGIEQWVKAASSFQAETADPDSESEANVNEDDTESDETPIQSSEDSSTATENGEDQVLEEIPTQPKEEKPMLDDDEEDEEVGLLDDEEE